jgi:hypothetical protein
MGPRARSAEEPRRYWSAANELVGEKGRSELVIAAYAKASGLSQPFVSSALSKILFQLSDHAFRCISIRGGVVGRMALPDRLTL